MFSQTNEKTFLIRKTMSGQRKSFLIFASCRVPQNEIILFKIKENIEKNVDDSKKLL